jgi:hypothetical protein
MMTEASNVAPMIHVSVNNDQLEERYLHLMQDEKQKGVHNDVGVGRKRH